MTVIYSRLNKRLLNRNQPILSTRSQSSSNAGAVRRVKKMSITGYGTTASVSARTAREDPLPTGDDAYEIMDQLEKWADRLGPEADVQDLIDELANSLEKAELKQSELEVLGFLAMHSNEPSIVELRKQLFLQVKMFHAKEVENVMGLVKENIEYEKNHYSGDCSPDIMEQARTTPGRVIDGVFNWMRRNIKLRKFTNKGLNR